MSSYNDLLTKAEKYEHTYIYPIAKSYAEQATAFLLAMEGFQEEVKSWELSLDYSSILEAYYNDIGVLYRGVELVKTAYDNSKKLLNNSLAERELLDAKTEVKPEGESDE